MTLSFSLKRIITIIRQTGHTILLEEEAKLYNKLIPMVLWDIKQKMSNSKLIKTIERLLEAANMAASAAPRKI